jgi:hypothetical protein
MPTEYVNITQQEMEAFLSPMGFQQITLPGTVELVYAKLIRHDGLVLSLRVYTGINPSGQSREVGDDAIRADLWWRENATATPVRVGSSKRVHRVKGWRANLQNRLDKWLEFAPIRCKSCGKPMVAREGPHGRFYGCVGWKRDKSGCNNVVKINDPA